MKTRRVRITNGRVLDLYSGIGGAHLGLREAGFNSITGMEKDPLAVTIHRARVGPCWEGTIDEMIHPPFPADVVFSDIPWEGRSSRKLTGTDVVPELEIFSTFKVGVEALSQVIVFVLVPQGATAVFDTDTHRFESVRYIEEVAKHNRLLVSTTIMDGVHFGLPQYRKRVVCVAFRGQELRDKFKWPKPTHLGTRRTHKLVTVQDVLGIEYPYPSPTVTASEFKSSWKGQQGGTSIARRASERIAGYVGRAKWGDRNVCLEPHELAALQGLPSWDWSRLPKRHSLPLIGRAFPPVMAQALGSSIYQALYR